MQSGSHATRGIASLPGSGAIISIVVGLLIPGLLVAAIFWMRDPIVAAVPGLEPLLPPKVVPVPPRPKLVVMAPLEPVESGSTDLSGLFFVGTMLVVIALMVLATFGPLVFPIWLSRRGWLSVGRWAALAALLVFWFALAVLCVEGWLRIAVGDSKLLAGLAAFIMVPLFSGVSGCLLAAAIHPKTPQP